MSFLKILNCHWGFFRVRPLTFFSNIWGNLVRNAASIRTWLYFDKKRFLIAGLFFEFFSQFNVFVPVNSVGEKSSTKRVTLVNASL